MQHLPLHTIRLAGPWEFQVAAGSDEWRTFKTPAEWNAIIAALGTEGAAPRKHAHPRETKGDLVARRRFQRPTGLDGGVRVWIVIPGAGRESIRLRFNESEPFPAMADHPLGTAFDVTDSLLARNVVKVEFDISRLMTDDARGARFPGAVIEIHAAANA